MGDSSTKERVLSGEVRAAARLMRDLDDGVPAARELLRELFPHAGKAYVVGLTGSPGAGKSTLTSKLVGRYRAAHLKVGVVAVDPSSPYTGGALLGDRIRMQEHALDPEVFIRSMATRGNLGGLSRSTAEVVQVMDAMGKDVVLVETVGVGQDEIEVAGLAHTVVVVTLPGLGDDVQAIKAGVFEIADVFVVNKADREGADRAVRDLEQMLEMRRPSASRPRPAHERVHREAKTVTCGAGEPVVWEPRIVRTVAVRDEGVDDLARAIEQHRSHLDETGGRRARDMARARAFFLALLRERLLAGALDRLSQDEGHLDEIAVRIARREADPFRLVEELAGRLRA